MLVLLKNWSVTRRSVLEWWRCPEVRCVLHIHVQRTAQPFERTWQLWQLGTLCLCGVYWISPWMSVPWLPELGLNSAVWKTCIHFYVGSILIPVTVDDYGL